MRELLSEKSIEYMDRAHEVAEKYVRPAAAELDRTGEYGWEILEALKKYELTGVWIPEEYGGHGRGVLDLCLIVEQLSRACPGVGVAYAVNALGSFPIIVGGTDEQKQKYLPAVAAGEKLIAFGLSEKPSGSDAGSLRTTAIKDGDHYVINGEKKWNTNGGVASLFTIYALSDPDKGMRGISAFIVEKDTPGFKVGKREDTMGIRTVPVNELEFSDCRVPAKNLLGGKEGVGFKNAMMTLDRARPGVAAQGLGLAQGGLSSGPTATPASAASSARLFRSSRPTSSSSRTWQRRSRRLARWSTLRRGSSTPARRTSRSRRQWPRSSPPTRP